MPLMTHAVRIPSATTSSDSPIAEEIRLRLADAWGEMGAAWGVAPAIARVHAYLMARQEPLTEREVREALGLSHRAASLALAESEAWGLVERVSEPRRVGRRGPRAPRTRRWATTGGGSGGWSRNARSARATRSFGAREHAGRCIATLAHYPDDADLIRLRDWLSTFLIFVRLFDRAVGLVSRLEPTELERAVRLLGEVPDETVLRLVKLLDGLPRRGRAGTGRRPEPAVADSCTPRATTLMSGVVRTLVR